MAGSLPTAPGESAGVPDADFPLDRLGWIDAFFAQVQEHLCIRPADAVLILPPSQVLRLNAGGLRVLEHLIARGNSVIVVEHSPELIGRADWVIDLGPGGGEEGGQLVAAGTPEAIAACPASVTGRYLRDRLGPLGE